MSSYREYKKKALQNPEVKAEYDALGPEYDIIQTDNIMLVSPEEFIRRWETKKDDSE